jgi:hypothetical protein
MISKKHLRHILRLLAVLFSIIAPPAFAEQPFYADTGVTFPGLRRSSIAVADFNGDDYLDVLMAGAISGPERTYIFKNNGDGTFTDIGADMKGIDDASVLWFDYNNDNRPDALIAGFDTAAGTAVTEIYRNDGGRSFSRVTGTNLPAMYSGGVANADFDKDGDQDLLIVGKSNGPSIARIYRNNGDGTFSDIYAGIVNMIDGAVKWADIDNDSFPDAFVTGSGLSTVYFNNKNGTFTGRTANLSGLSTSTAAFGDINGDGLVDIMQMGVRADGSQIVEYGRNLGNRTFGTIKMPFVYGSTLLLEDANNDGALDVLIGTPNNGPYLYTNDKSSSTFTAHQQTFAPSRSSLSFGDGSMAWFDFNRDGAKDILITGTNLDGPIGKLLKGNRKFAISGQVITSEAGVGGVLISSSSSHSDTTDFMGFFTLPQLESGNEYTLTPSKAGYTFLPESRTFKLEADITNANFAAIQQATDTPTIAPTSTHTPTTAPTRTRTPTSTYSHTATATPTRTSTATYTPTITQTVTYTASPTPSPTRTPTITSTPTVMPTASSTTSPTPTRTLTQTPTRTSTPTGTPTAPSTQTPTTTSTPTRTPTRTPTDTPSETPTKTAIPSLTPSATATSSRTPTSTSTPTHTPTFTASPAFVAAPAATPTPALMVMQADLVPKSVVGSSPKKRNVKINITIENQGRGASAPSSAVLYLSVDKKLDTRRDFSLGSVGVLSLLPGATQTATLSKTLPKSFKSGKYWILVRADSMNLIAEGNETNNSSISLRQVIIK